MWGMNKLPYAKKSLGQHWLTDPETLQAIVDAADVTLIDTVLEIGPGGGTLTRLLTEQADQVVAVEFDQLLAATLPGKVPAANLTIVHQDILKFDLTTMPSGYKVVANIPYYLTSNLIRTLSESTNPPVTAVLLIQKEVAERVAAAPGSMSLLSVSAQFYWDVSLASIVPARMFTPAPKVDSQILILHRREVLPFPVEEKLFFRLVKAGFSNRRKTLLNSLSGGLGKTKTEISAILVAANLNPQSRPQELSLEDWHNLYQQLGT